MAFLKPLSCSFFCFAASRLGSEMWHRDVAYDGMAWDCSPPLVVLVSVGSTGQVHVRG